MQSSQTSSTSNFSILKVAALLEGTSLLLLLLVAMPMKYAMGIPEAVKIIGPIHGVLFVLFNIVLFTHAMKGHLGFFSTMSGFFASFIPLGTFIYKAKVLKPKSRFA
ncbi:MULTISPECIES: DUF3817 domain-containing protein [Thiomicrorhabdus]|uniref:DUF3817 domain-containing protein n=1 Tax=Thiomicrorhabdus xiamenensis TaxID=2739063 RepID=A0A7D4TFN3_9GAMM|nr:MULTISPECIES: DUF3817 domain-containing protein [Thiomicrorhabdus]MBO1924097.1 DUF3817 domain-containing protein [Thiomicrorhabdus sp. 6S3-12]QKI89028.1 DUF3817 domain-containing protein [Thiomicrorhabdus xiamenensis]